MMYYTHLLFAVVFALLLMPFNVSPYIAFPLILLGGVFPDIDSPGSFIGRKLRPLNIAVTSLVKHRGIFHTIWFVLAVYFGFFFFAKQYLIYANLFLMGYFSHLLIDGFTIQGINFFHPFAKLHLSGFIETNTTAEKVLAIVLFILIIFLIF